MITYATTGTTYNNGGSVISVDKIGNIQSIDVSNIVTDVIFANEDDYKLSTGNSSTTPLASGLTFTGVWEDVKNYDSLIVGVKTDSNGTLTVQYSPDGTNLDSSSTRYYRTNQIEAPHRFTNARRYARIIFTDTGGIQTYFRLQTMYGDKTPLNGTSDSVLSQDYDATVVRPTDYHYEVALGKRQGVTTWNKFGYNDDIDIGTETIWSNGGLFSRMTSADTLSVSSTNTADGVAGSGARSIIVYGVDQNFASKTEVVTLNGTGVVATTGQWYGVNRAAIYLAGSGISNVGNINLLATSAASTQAVIPAEAGTTQHSFYFVQADHIALMDWLYFSMVKNAGGTQPKVMVTAYVTSLVSGSRYEVFRDYLNGTVENHIQLNPSQPFVIGEKSLIEFRATTDVNDTSVSLRFSLIEYRDVDG